MNPGQTVVMAVPAAVALAVALPAHADRTANALRAGDPAVVARVDGGACLVDLRCIDPDHDDRLAQAVLAALVVVGTEGSP